MSELSEFRRQVLKKSQKALSEELGYEKWQTYAAQEAGKNPLPLEVKERLEKKFKFKGAWPDQERAAPVLGRLAAQEDGDRGGISDRELGRLEGLIEAQGAELRRLRRRLEEAFVLIQDLGRRAGIEASPGEPVE